MKLLTVCAVMGLGIAGVVAWEFLGESTPPRTASGSGVGNAAVEMGSPAATGSAFVDMPMPDGLPSRGVVIFAPANCPSDAAQRADALARYLSARGIAHVLASAAEFNNLGSQEEADRVTSVMNGPIPVVYVDGKAKANPTPEDVEAEYRRTRRG